MRIVLPAAFALLRPQIADKNDQPERPMIRATVQFIAQSARRSDRARIAVRPLPMSDAFVPARELTPSTRALDFCLALMDKYQRRVENGPRKGGSVVSLLKVEWLGKPFEGVIAMRDTSFEPEAETAEPCRAAAQPANPNFFALREIAVATSGAPPEAASAATSEAVGRREPQPAAKRAGRLGDSISKRSS